MTFLRTLLAGTVAATTIAALGTANADARASHHLATKDLGTAAGKVIAVKNGKPIAGVKVRVTDWSTKKTLGSDITNRAGRYSVGPINDDEVGVYVNGTDAGFEKGWLGCNNKIVATWGDACTFSPDDVGLIKLKLA